MQAEGAIRPRTVLAGDAQPTRLFCARVAPRASALKVIDEGSPATAPLSALTDRGSTFYATEPEKKAKGESRFEGASRRARWRIWSRA